MKVLGPHGTAMCEIPSSDVKLDALTLQSNTMPATELGTMTVEAMA